MRIGITTDTHWGFSFRGDEENIKLLKCIQKENLDLLIHCGDFGSSCLEDRREYWKIAREILGKDLSIGTVFGNHDFWEWPVSPGSTLPAPQKIVFKNISLLREFNIQYLPTGLEIADSTTKLYFMGMDGWYHEDVRSNDKNYMAPEARQWLLERMYDQFHISIKALRIQKDLGFTTFLVSHFGIIEEAANQDYKARGHFGKLSYFGADPTLENFLDPVDYYLFGHSHSHYVGTAKNGTTKILNVGGNYETPKYEVIIL